MHRECRERFPCHRLQRKPLVGHVSRHVRHERAVLYVGIANQLKIVVSSLYHF